MLNFNILLDVQQLVVLSTAAQTMWPREEAGKKKKKKKRKENPHVACDNLVQATLLLHNAVIFREGEIGG